MDLGHGLLEHQISKPLGQHVGGRRNRPGLKPNPRHGPLKAEAPKRPSPQEAERSIPAAESPPRRSNIRPRPRGDIPLRVPGAVAATRIVRPAAMVDRQTIVRGEVAIEVDQDVHPIVPGKIGVADARARAGLVSRPGSLPATNADVEELGVVGEHDRGRPLRIVVQAAVQGDRLGLPPDRIVQPPVQSRPLRRLDARQDRLAATFLSAPEARVRRGRKSTTGRLRRRSAWRRAVGPAPGRPACDRLRPREIARPDGRTARAESAPAGPPTRPPAPGDFLSRRRRPPARPARRWRNAARAKPTPAGPTDRWDIRPPSN